MAERPGLSLGQLMRLVVLAAFNLALFQGVWWLTTFPPIAMLVIVLNMTLLIAWVRRRPLSRPELAALLAGLVAAVAMVPYLGSHRNGPWLARRLLHALPGEFGDRLTGAVRGTSAAWNLEYALLIGMGVLAMVAASFLPRLAARRRAPHEGPARLSSP